MVWWLWLLLGLALLLAELVTPGGFYLMFFGIGGLIVGVLTAGSFAGPAWMQWLLFTVFSVAGVLIFRPPLTRRLRINELGRDVDPLEGEKALILEEIPVNGLGKAEMRGAAWNARNVGGAPLLPGQRCRVERIEGLEISVRPE